MLVDLVRIPTPDGCQLDAALQRPTSPSPGLDAVCLIHGTGSNFYSATLLEFFATRLIEKGTAVLRANTRGHDGISFTIGPKGGLRLGAAFEIVDDCRHDLLGLVSWLRTNVGPNVALLGHSLGAVKCLYATAFQAELQPAFVLAVSPPRLSYATFCQSPKAEAFLSAYRQAEELAEAGRGGALIESTVPLPMLIAANGYLEKYGPDERYNFLNFLRYVRCPTLFLFGAREVADNVAFQQLPDEIESRRAKAPHLAVETIANGDHFYSGVRNETWHAIDAWLAGLTSSPHSGNNPKGVKPE